MASIAIFPWYALQVASRCERAVASGLAMRGYSAFLPLFRSRRQWSDRFQDIDLPLFPGYVFSRLDVNHRLPALLIPGVVRIVGLGKIPVPVDEEEMTAVQAIVESGLFMRPFPFLKIGQTVTIQSSAAVSRRRAPAQFCSAGGGRRRLGRTAARDRRLGRRRLAGFRRTAMDAALDEQSRYHWNQRGWRVGNLLADCQPAQFAPIPIRRAG